MVIFTTYCKKACIKQAPRYRPPPPRFFWLICKSCLSNLTFALAVREQHGRDESAFSVPPPDAVVFAEVTQDASDAVALCARYRAPTIAFGVGSSLKGPLLAVQGGVSLDVSRMNKALAILGEAFD